MAGRARDGQVPEHSPKLVSTRATRAQSQVDYPIVLMSQAIMRMHIASDHAHENRKAIMLSNAIMQSLIKSKVSHKLNHAHTMRRSLIDHQRYGATQ